jgi:hypothetical protein
MVTLAANSRERATRRETTMTAATCARPSFVPVLAAASVTIPR